MVHKFRSWRGFIFLLSVFIYLLSVLFPFSIVRTLLSVSSILSLVVAFPYAARTSKLLILLFLGTGVFCIVQSGISWTHIFESFGSMASLLSLFSVVPLIAIPVKVGHYETSVNRLLTQKHLSPRKLYLTISGLSYLLGSLMNIATIPMMYQSVHRVVEGANIPNSKRFLVQSIVTGYAMPLIWSPVAAVVAAVVSVTNVSLLSVWPITIAISLAGLALSVLLSGHKAYQLPVDDATCELAAASEEAPTSDVPAKRPDEHSLWHLPIGVIVFIVLMLLVEHFTHWSMIEVITVLSIPFAWAWSALVGESRSFALQLQMHPASVQKLHNTFGVFTAAGFFVEALQHSKFIDSVNHAFLTTSQTLGPSLFIALIPVITIALSMIGLHPVVSIALLGTSLHPSVLHMSPLWLSVALFGGGVLTFIVSPFNATLNVTGTVTGQKPSTVMKWNLKFCLCFLAFIMILAAAGQAL